MSNVPPRTFSGPQFTAQQDVTRSDCAAAQVRAEPLWGVECAHLEGFVADGSSAHHTLVRRSFPAARPAVTDRKSLLALKGVGRES
jgi:hypothetical protein